MIWFISLIWMYNRKKKQSLRRTFNTSIVRRSFEKLCSHPKKFFWFFNPYSYRWELPSGMRRGFSFFHFFLFFVMTSNSKAICLEGMLKHGASYEVTYGWYTIIITIIISIRSYLIKRNQLCHMYSIVLPSFFFWFYNDTFWLNFIFIIFFFSLDLGEIDE